jgi:hypothetical protein
VLCVVLYQAVILGTGLSPALEGRLIDVDGYTHLVRATELQEHGRWYDTVLQRSNAPFGVPMHWTRPFDLVLLSGAFAGTPFLGFHDALWWWGLFVPAVGQLLTALLLVWAAQPLLRGAARAFLGLVFLLQMAVSSYSMAGRPDHHLLLLAAFVLGLGLTIRLVMRPYARHRALLAGAVAGGGLWFSIELLIPYVAIVGALALAWARGGGDRVRTNVWHATGALLAATTALMLERPPSQWTVVTYDRLSIVALAPPALALLWWAGVGALERRRGTPLPAAHRRGLLGLGLLAAAAAGVAAFSRGFLGSTMVADEGSSLFFSSIAENQPLFPTDAASLARCLLSLGSVLVAAPWLVRLVRRAPDERTRDAWLTVGVALAVCLAPALRLARLAPYPELLATLPLCALLIAALEGLGGIRPFILGAALRAGTALALLLGPLLLGVLAGAAAAEAPEAARDRAAVIQDDEPPCGLPPLVDALLRPDGLGARVQIILADPTWGPELMYRTPHHVVGSPDHRNVDGIRDCVAFFRTDDMQAAHDIARARGVTLVAVCVDWLEAAASQYPQDTLLGRMATGGTPAWMRPVELPEGSAAFRIYDVTD